MAEYDFLVDTGSNDVLTALQSQLQSGEHNLVAFVGAGVSKQAGLPLWTELMKLMDDEVQRVRPRTPQERQLALKHADLLWQAELFRLELERSAAYERFLRRSFRRKLTEGKDVLKSLVRGGFRHFITTNYDTLLEQALEDAGVDYEELDWTDRQECRSFFVNSLLVRRSPFVIHIHGRSDYPRTVVLSHRDYVQRYVQTSEYADKLSVLFATTKVVFIGFSLDDPDLKYILRQVNSRFGAGDVQHFALLGVEDSTQTTNDRKRLELQFGIAPIFYSSQDGHAALRKVLEALPAVAPAGPIATDLGVDFRIPVVEKRAGYAAPSMTASSVWNDDPHKGQFGGASVDPARTRRLSATYLCKREGSALHEIRLTVEALNGHDLTGPVTFYLHPTFPKPVVEVEAANNKAQMTVAAYGAFTAGAECDKRQTRLELDLSELQEMPADFRAL